MDRLLKGPREYPNSPKVRQLLNLWIKTGFGKFGVFAGAFRICNDDGLFVGSDPRLELGGNPRGNVACHERSLGENNPEGRTARTKNP